jgi:dCMP deaminase
MRISRHSLFMEIAHVVSKRSTCFRLNVGAVVVVQNRIVSIGYNGAPPGKPHCTGNSCPGRNGCHETIHAEVNAIDYVPPSMFGNLKDFYVTDSPCADCMRYIGVRCVSRLFFDRLYRKSDHLEKYAHLFPGGIYQVTPSGYVIDWATKEIVDEK